MRLSLNDAMMGTQHLHDGAALRRRRAFYRDRSNGALVSMKGKIMKRLFILFLGLMLAIGPFVLVFYPFEDGRLFENVVAAHGRLRGADAVGFWAHIVAAFIAVPLVGLMAIGKTFERR